MTKQRTFLEEVAAKLFQRYGEQVSSLTLVMPSRRAGLFFSQALSKLSPRPIWQPRYISMDDIMCEASSFEKGDKIRIITELYKIYSTHHKESFDKFYFWGEMLLGDFDLVDKYMIDADKLFCNIYDLKELEADLSYLTPEMRAIIRAFWSHFSDEESLSEEKQKFLDIWRTLSPVYHSLKERLAELKFAYTGMIYRSAAENVASGEGTPDLEQHYVFIGFNALCECEKRMLKYLATNAQCDFYWDYDSYYTAQSEQEAGGFLRENLNLFKPSDEITHDNFLSISKEISAISTVSNVVQCKYVNTILHEISPELKFDTQTAIVLTDESLLMPLLHSLPEELKSNINVTMGYPLRQTTAYSFMERLIELQRNARRNSSGVENFYHIDVVGIITHPFLMEREGELCKELHGKILKGKYIRIEPDLMGDNKLIKLIFSTTADWQGLSKYLLEVMGAIVLWYNMEEASREQRLTLSYIQLISEGIAEITNCVKECDIELTTSIFTSLLKRHLQTIRIPFSGEPLQGLQVMGILETRNLDFKNVIILSMNDDNFPGNRMGDSSFIPYNLRAAYGMPTPEHHEGVYAYYFYRLLQRAERVDMLYCSHADSKTTGEQSRYIYQLQFESPYPIRRINVGVDVAATEIKTICIEKQGRTLEKLNALTDPEQKKRLSPKALTLFLECGLKFYFSYIAEIKESEELSEEVDNRIFGNIIHKAMQILYNPLLGVMRPEKELKAMLKAEQIQEAVDIAIQEEFLKSKNSTREDYTGNLILIRDIATRYIGESIIPFDIRNNGFSLQALEGSISHRFALGDGREVLFGGYADRIDLLESGEIRVVDYKTGKQKLELKVLKNMFESASIRETKYILQTLLYSMMLNKEQGRNVYPSLFFVKYMQNSKYSPYITTLTSQKLDYLSIADEFESLLHEKLIELFDPSTPFTQCENKKVCENCDFKQICKR